jgi:hypothetical protein
MATPFEYFANKFVGGEKLPIDQALLDAAKNSRGAVKAAGQGKQAVDIAMAGHIWDNMPPVERRRWENECHAFFGTKPDPSDDDSEPEAPPPVPKLKTPTPAPEPKQSVKKWVPTQQELDLPLADPIYAPQIELDAMQVEYAPPPPLGEELKGPICVQNVESFFRRRRGAEFARAFSLRVLALNYRAIRARVYEVYEDFNSYEDVAALVTLSDKVYRGCWDDPMMLRSIVEKGLTVEVWGAFKNVY